jgi:hypothetical protein
LLFLAAKRPKPARNKRGHHCAHAAVGAIKGLNGSFEAPPVVQVYGGEDILCGKWCGERAQAAARNTQRMLDVQLRAITCFVVEPITPSFIESSTASPRLWLDGRKAEAAQVSIGHDNKVIDKQLIKHSNPPARYYPMRIIIL